jgi:methionyl-tRNA formyltransferase
VKTIIVNSNPVHQKIEETCRESFSSLIINSKKKLNYNNLIAIKPDYIFFLHWSYIIPKEIFENFNCIVFHMTDLPYGRGGSPLQNLIIRGHSETMISAIKVDQGIDAGPVFLKKPLSLEGTAEEIFLRAGKTMFKMIKEIIAKHPKPVKQKGKVVTFKRRTPGESNMIAIADIKTVYNFIRMLDAEGYPKAFIETEFLKFEFSNALLKEDGITAHVKIKKKS